jgi:hypothetical protein
VVPSGIIEAPPCCFVFATLDALWLVDAATGVTSRHPSVLEDDGAMGFVKGVAKLDPLVSSATALRLAGILVGVDALTTFDAALPTGWRFAKRDARGSTGVPVRLAGSFVALDALATFGAALPTGRRFAKLDAQGSTGVPVRLAGSFVGLDALATFDAGLPTA